MEGQGKEKKASKLVLKDTTEEDNHALCKLNGHYEGMLEKMEEE